MLGHGAGGGVDAPDLLAAARTARATGWAVARVLQPYRVAGRRAPAPLPRLDAAWREVIGALREEERLRSVPLVTGGRSSGARIACRTATAVEASAVLALAFPLHPPGRPHNSRADELRQAGVPVRIVQGERDAFGSAADVADALAALGIDDVGVHAVPAADHALRGAPAAEVIAAVVGELLAPLSR